MCGVRRELVSDVGEGNWWQWWDQGVWEGGADRKLVGLSGSDEKREKEPEARRSEEPRA